MTAMMTDVSEHVIGRILPPCDVKQCDNSAAWTLIWKPIVYCPKCGDPIQLICAHHRPRIDKALEIDAWATCPCGHFHAPVRELLIRIDPI